MNTEIISAEERADHKTVRMRCDCCGDLEPCRCDRAHWCACHVTADGSPAPRPLTLVQVALTAKEQAHVAQ